MTDSMTCAAFERWLDRGSPPEGEAEALAHAAACARCAAALEAMRGIDAILRSPAPAAPRDFTDGVMQRVAEASAARAARPEWASADEALPWWIAAAGQPATVLAAGLAALVMWRAEALFAAGAAAARATGAGWDAFSRLAGNWLAPLASLGIPTDPAVQVGIGLALLPAVLLLSLRLERWSETLVGR